MYSAESTPSGEKNSEEVIFEKGVGNPTTGERSQLERTIEASAGVEETGQFFDVTLYSAGTRKGYVIGVIRDWLGISLKEAAKLIKKTPVLLKKGVTREEAEAMKVDLEKVWAILNNGKAICGSCGRVFENIPPYEKETAGQYIMKLNCRDRNEFQNKMGEKKMHVQIRYMIP